MDINVLLFPDFTAMDFIGPVEVLQRIPEFRIRYISMKGGLVGNKEGLTIVTEPLSAINKGILLIPGGMGTRPAALDDEFIRKIRTVAEESVYVLTICTGAVLLGRTGLLDGKKATSNKIAMAWVEVTCPKVQWQHSARWVRTGSIYTASGVTAGMDMALGFIADQYGKAKAMDIARRMEYVWNDDAGRDPFAV